MASGLDLALNVVAGLQPALALMRLIWDEVGKVETNRNKCESLVRRANRILITVNGCLEKSHREDIDVHENLQKLRRNLEFVATLIRNIGSLSFLKSLLARDNIAMRIEEAHARLTDSLTAFQISTAAELRKHQAEDEAARVADMEWMQQRLKGLENNDGALIRIFQVHQNEMLEAILAMQNNIVNNVGNCVERRLLQTGLASFQRSTRQTAPGRIPSWLITSFEIDVEDDSILGLGSFGTVKKAVWRGIPVAVKFMTPDTEQKLLLREIKIWKNLRHDHIVPFYGASTVANPPFFVCRFMQNGNLVKYFRANMHANRVKLAHEIALGMLYLHDNHIVHGDLKPANILVDDSGRACIADFGLSKIQYDARSRAPSSITTPGPVGTLRFMSPQQLRGVMSKASDVYSYSMTLYEAFVGEVPFSMVPDHVLFDVICREGQRLRRPSSTEVLSRGLTDDAWDIIWRCSDPDDSLRPTFLAVAQKMDALNTSWQQNDAIALSHATDLFSGLYLDTDDGSSMDNTRVETAEIPGEGLRLGDKSAAEANRRDALAKWCGVMNAYLNRHAEERSQPLERVLDNWKHYYSKFFVELKPHFMKLNLHLRQLQGQRFTVVDYQCNALWAESVIRNYPEAVPFALDYGTSVVSSWLNRFGGNATRITSLDPALEDPFDASLWWTPAPMTFEDYRLHLTLLRKGGIILGAVNLRDWTEDEYSRDIVEPQGFRLLQNWLARVSYPSAEDSTPYRFFALESI